MTLRVAAGLDADGRVTAFDWEARGISGRLRPSATEHFGDTLAAQLIGGHRAASSDLFQFGDEPYTFPAKRKVSHLVAWGNALPTGLRTAHLRDPDGMATCFASECFVDELAAAAHADPVEFRLGHLGEGRAAAAIRAAAERAEWHTRPGPMPGNARQGIVTGRGIAIARRAGTMVATVAEVEVNMDTGALRVTRFVVAHDCGFVVNPLGLRGAIEANLVQAMSRAMHEEVMFDATHVTSVDWASYPIVDMTEVPDTIDIVLLNDTPDKPMRGAGEPATRPTAAAIANAIWDATGVRVRRVPFTPERLSAAFREAKSRA